MFRNQRPIYLALLGASLLAGCSDATPSGPAGLPEVQAINYWDKKSTSVDGDVAEAARKYVVKAPELTPRGGDWKVRGQAETRGFHHVRLHQYQDGVRVWGGDLVAHTSGKKFESVKGNLVKNLEGFDVKPAIAAEAALQTAKAEYARGVKLAAAPLAYSREQTELVIFPQKGRDAKLAWHTEFFTELQAGMKPGLWNYFIDAKTGELLGQFNAIHTIVPQASGPGGNAKVARTWDSELDVTATGGGQYKMDTDRLLTVNMNQSTTTETIVTGPLDPISDAPIDDAHGFAEQTLNMLDEWMGHNSIDDQGFKIKSRVHYDVAYENAFWDGTQMTYGDGASTFYPLSGDVDVVAHEIAHGFTSFHSNLIYQSQSGGMNESFSDISGTITEFFSEGAGADFDIGRDIFKGDTALRFMCDPTADGISIDNFANYNDGIDVHYSSGIMNKAFCMSAQGLGGGTATPEAVRRVGTAFYTANAGFWVESSTFQQGCQGVMDASASLGFTEAERDTLRNSWAAVGVYCDGLVEPIICDETLTTDDGELTSPNFPGQYPNNFSRTYCIKPASNAPATLTFPEFNTEANFDFVTIKDGNLGTVLSTTSGSVAPPPATSAFLVIKFTTDTSVTATGWRATWGTGGTTNTPPTVAITAPANNAQVSGTVTVTADASDADGTISKVRFTLPNGGAVEDTTAPFETTFNSALLADGIYAITAKAFDDLGTPSTDATVSVDVQNDVQCVDGTFTATNLPVAIPDNFPGGVTSGVAVFSPGNVGTVSLSLNITHAWRGDLKVILVSPTGTQHVVHDRTGGSADDLVLADLALPAFVGVQAAGQWQLKVVDTASGDTGALNSWSLTIVGNCAPSGEFSVKAEPNLPLVDNGSACTTMTVAGQMGDASAVRLDADGHHDFRSVLRGTLAHNGVTVDAFPTGTFPVNAGDFSLQNRAVTGLGGDVNGDWTLCIIDTDAFGDTGTLLSWRLHD